jgi:hypothetical protein
MGIRTHAHTFDSVINVSEQQRDNKSPLDKMYTGHWTAHTALHQHPQLS